MSTTQRILSGLGLAFAIGVSATASAQYSGPQAIPPMTSVKQIQEDPKNDRPIALRGYLTKQISNEQYIFTDGTGDIKVDIDKKKFPEGTINEKTKVELFGEIDKGSFKDVEIDVDRIVIVH